MQHHLCQGSSPTCSFGREAGTWGLFTRPPRETPTVGSKEGARATPAKTLKTRQKTKKLTWRESTADTIPSGRGSVNGSLGWTHLPGLHSTGRAKPSRLGGPPSPGKHLT